jgi:hypothetical protein
MSVHRRPAGALGGEDESGPYDEEDAGQQEKEADRRAQ